jgi:hypothetical protein
VMSKSTFRNSAGNVLIPEPVDRAIPTASGFGFRRSSVARGVTSRRQEGRITGGDDVEATRHDG